MIDYLFGFPDQATAQADAAVGAYWTPANADSPASWRGDCCIPNVQVIAIATGQPIDTYWRIIVSRPERDAALEASAALELAADRDLATAGQPPSAFILASSVPASEWPALQVSPTFAGSNYPFGGLVP